MSDPYAIGRSVGRRVCRRVVGTLAAAMIALGAVSAPLALASDVGGIARVSIVERGIYAAFDEGRPVARGSLGPVARIANATLAESTELIPAHQMLRFGLRYVVEGLPFGSAIDLRLVTRFPEAGLIDPVTRIRHTASEYTIAAKVGIVAYREFQFHQPWEIAPGEWAFEFWVADRMIGSQKFCIVEAGSGSRGPVPQCSVLIGLRTLLADRPAPLGQRTDREIGTP